MNPDELTTLEGFSFSIAADVPDKTKAQFFLDVTDGTDTWQSKINITLHAPILTFVAIEKTDDNLAFTFKNNGTAPFYGGTLNVYSSSTALMFGETTINFEDVVAGDETITLNNSYSFGEGIEPGTTFETAYELISGLNSVEGTYVMTYGSIMEDFDSNNFGSDWTFSSQYPWTIVAGGYDGSN